MYVRGELCIVFVCLFVFVVFCCNVMFEFLFWNVCVFLVLLFFDVYEVGKCSNLYFCEECYE